MSKIVDTVVGYDTPLSVPDVFGHAQPSQGGLGALTGAGFRGGGGGLANIASILGASGITFKQPDDSDDDDEDFGALQIIGDKPDGTYIDGKGLDKETKPKDVTNDMVG